MQVRETLWSFCKLAGNRHALTPTPTYARSMLDAGCSHGTGGQTGGGWIRYSMLGTHVKNKNREKLHFLTFDKNEGDCGWLHCICWRPSACIASSKASCGIVCIVCIVCIFTLGGLTTAGHARVHLLNMSRADADREKTDRNLIMCCYCVA